jgi:hypothetical protein
MSDLSGVLVTINLSTNYLAKDNGVIARVITDGIAVYFRVSAIKLQIAVVM